MPDSLREASIVWQEVAPWTILIPFSFVLLANDAIRFYNEIMFKNRARQSGQVLLITLLVASIGVTVVLSLLARTTTDVTLSNQIAESLRAFNAAEAGIEEALKTGGVGAGPQVLAPGVSYSVTQANIGGAAGVYQFPVKTSRGNSETLWLVNHRADGAIVETPTYTAPTLDVCWSSETTTPAMVVTVFYKTAAGVYRLARGAWDPDGSRRSLNKFSNVTAATGGCGADTGTTYRQTVTFASFTPVIDPASDTLLSFRIMPVYSDAKLVINATASLPLQGSRLESSGTTEAGVTRKIVVFHEFHSPPTILDSVIYSQGNFGH